MFDLLELQKKLSESQNQQQQQTRQVPYYRMRTVAIDEVARMLKAGFSPDEIGYYLNLSIATVEAEMAMDWLMYLSEGLGICASMHTRLNPDVGADCAILEMASCFPENAILSFGSKAKALSKDCI